MTKYTIGAMRLPSSEVVQRLALIKYMAQEGLEHSRRASPWNAPALLTLHSAVELFLHLACEHKGAPLPTKKQQLSFHDYFTALEKVGYTVAGQVAMAAMNQARVDLKHHGNRPHADSMESFRASVPAFLSENTPGLFNGRSFSDVALTDMVACEGARRSLATAEADWKKGEPEEARRSLALAFEELLKDYRDRNRQPNATRSPLDLRPSWGSVVRQGSRLPGDAGRLIDEVVKEIGRIGSALTIIAAGIDYKKYVKFMMLTSTVPRAGVARAGDRLGSRDPGELTRPVYERCFSFVIESALRLQEFEFVFASPES